MHAMISKMGLLLALLLSLPAWAESAITMAGKEGYAEAPAASLQANTAGQFRVETQAEAQLEWDSNQVLGWLMVLACIGGFFFWLGRRRTGASLAGALRQITPKPSSDNKPQTPAKASQAVQPLFSDPVSIEVEALNSVEEEAEVFLLLGRMDLAIGVLRHYIESSGDAPAHAWMSLLDILHVQGLRLEFEKLALEIRGRFNIALPTWEMANARSNGMASLEHFPHLFAKITKQWRTPQCAGYLRSLVQDNRDGGRGGFNMEAFRELLFLINLMEQKD
jgi:hypothetical protein